MPWRVQSLDESSDLDQTKAEKAEKAEKGRNRSPSSRTLSPQPPSPPSGSVRDLHPQGWHVTEISHRIEARLDRISEQVDACLAEISRNKVLRLPGEPTSKVQGDLAPTTSTSLRRHLPFAVYDPAASADLADSRSLSGVLPASDESPISPRDKASLPLQGVPIRPNRNAGPARSVDLRLVSHLTQALATDDLPEHERPMHRLLHRSRCNAVWELLEDPGSSRFAWWISQLLKVLVTLSVAVTILQLSQEPIIIDGLAAALLETAFDVIFLFEFLCRIFSAPSKREYIKDPVNWADVASAIGLPLRVSIGLVIEESADPAKEAIQAILLFVLPLVRFLKLLRYFETIRLLFDAFRKSIDALPVLMYTMALMVLVSTFALYLAETRSNIPSIQHSLWLCLVTMTTVGYGDYVPKSAGGYVIMSLLTIASVLFLAMPVGIIGNEFNLCWQGRDQVLSISRIQKALLKWGYAAADVRQLFEYVDEDGDGQLNFSEFLELFSEMRIGVRADTMMTLFSMFDTDQSGHVDYSEFLLQIFPNEEAKIRMKWLRRSSSRKVFEAFKRLETSRSLNSIAEGKGDVSPAARHR